MQETQRTERLPTRQITLQTTFGLSKVERAWKEYVYPGLRSQEIVDLHDYYDYHININHLSKELRDRIIAGAYRPKSPIFIRLEKSKGMCRRLALPTPEDALVLQTIVETISPVLLRQQPSRNAFYSRSHQRKIPQLEAEPKGEYFWFKQWLEFSRRSFEISYIYPYMISADIANFFDNVGFPQLRNMLASYGQFDEGILDLLFLVLEGFSWRPDYLPIAEKGLPQVDFDGPRLLAHAFLFEADRWLSDILNDNFVRWNDDIDIPIDNYAKGKRLLRDFDDLLMSRGIRLSGGKTVILDGAAAKEYLLPNENRFLTLMANRINRLSDAGKPIDSEFRRLKRRFRGFLSYRRVGRWDKVYKRYFTIFGKYKNRYLERKVPDVLQHHPGIRSSVWKYYKDLGPSDTRFAHLEQYLFSEDCLDDASVFQGINVIVSWHIGPRSRLRNRAVQLAYKISDGKPPYFLGSLWLIAKYGTQEDVRRLIITRKRKWVGNEYLSRQVAAALPRYRDDSALCDLVREELTRRGHLCWRPDEWCKSWPPRARAQR